MNNDTYTDLMREFAHLLGLPGRFEQLLETGTLIFKDVALAIFLRESTRGHVHVSVDFGALPEVRTEEACRRLLEVNLLVSEQGNLRLALDGASNKVVLAYSYPLAGLTARQLLGSIDAAVQQAKDWRAGYFLDAPRVPEDLRYALAV